MPPGNGNTYGFTWAFRDDQRIMYDSVDDAVATGTLTDESLGGFFKDTRRGGETVVRVDVPSPAVRVGWHDHGVPHVRADSNRMVAFGAGCAVAESRLLVAELVRLAGRAGVLEVGGTDLEEAL